MISFIARRVNEGPAAEEVLFGMLIGNDPVHVDGVTANEYVNQYAVLAYGNDRLLAVVTTQDPLNG